MEKYISVRTSRTSEMEQWMTNGCSCRLDIIQWWNNIKYKKIGIGKLSGHVSKLVLFLENGNVWFPDEGG